MLRGITHWIRRPDECQDIGLQGTRAYSHTLWRLEIIIGPYYGVLQGMTRWGGDGLSAAMRRDYRVPKPGRIR